MHLALRPAEPVRRKISPNQEAQTADDDQGRDRQRNDGVIHKGGQGRKGRTNTHKIKTGVAESGNRVDYGKIQSSAPAEFRNKADCQKQRSHTLKNKGKGDDPANQAADAPQRYIACRLHQHLTVIQSHPSAEGGGNQRKDGHEAQAAKLDEEQNDKLSENRPAGIGVAHHQSGYAGGAGGSKQRIEKAGGFSLVGNRQAQQPCAHENHKEKAQSDQTHR